MEGEGDETLEAGAGASFADAPPFVLVRAQAQQMIHAVARLLDVADQHRAIGAEPKTVHLAVRLEPTGRVALVLADLLAYFGVENLRSPAGHGIHAGLGEALDDLAHGEL